MFPIYVFADDTKNVNPFRHSKGQNWPLDQSRDYIFATDRELWHLYNLCLSNTCLITYLSAN